MHNLPRSSAPGPRARPPSRRALAPLLALVAAGCTEPPREAVRPLRPEGLAPEVAQLVQRHVQAVAADRASGATHGELGLVYEANELWSEARASFANATALAPLEPSWSLHLAIATLQAGDFEPAVAELRALAARAPEFAPARHRLGNALLDSADPAGAREHFEATLRHAPRSPEGHVGLGRVALAEHDFARAATHLEEALRLDQRHAMARFLLAEAYRRLGRETEAAALAAKAGAPKKSFLLDAAGARAASYAAGSTAQMARAKRHLAAGEARAAIEILAPLAERHPERADVSNNLAIAWSAAGESERAIEVLRAALAADDTNASLHVSLAMACLDTGDAARALASAERALALEPAAGRAHFALGSALLRQERPEEARAALFAAHELDRKDPIVRLALGEACWRLGELEEAEAHLRAAAARLAENPAPHLLLARVLVSADRQQEARASFERARELAPQSREVARLAPLFAEEKGP